MHFEKGSVSVLIQGLKDGDSTAANHLWARYVQELKGVAKNALGNSPRTVADEDDVVTRAFQAFLRRTSTGAYQELSTRDDLWRLLVVITRTYAWKQSRFFSRLKRGGAANVSDVLSGLARKSESAESVAALRETLDSLLRGLDDEMKLIVIGRLEGKTHKEIANELNRNVRTIERRLMIIRDKWTQKLS